MFDVSDYAERAAVQFGIDILTVYELTPYEIGVAGRQMQERRNCDFEDVIALAWHVEAFARQKRLPSLNKLIKDIRHKPKKQDSRSDTILKAMAAAKGVTIK